MSETRTLVIGDIHGCLTALKTLLKTVKPNKADHLIFLGDYIDRGPDPKGVIDFLLAMKAPEKITFLRGNHEEAFVTSRTDKAMRKRWLRAWGGHDTLKSYGDDFENVPKSHWEFIEKTELYHKGARYLHVHANLEHDVKLSEQTTFTLLHKKLGTPLPHQSGKIMICGHTAQKSHVPKNLSHAVCIDTDPGRGGWLTCLHEEKGSYWQANETREVRMGKI